MTSRLQQGTSAYFNSDENVSTGPTIVIEENGENKKEEEEENIGTTIMNTVKKNQVAIIVGVVAVLGASSMAYFMVRRSKELKKKKCKENGFDFKETWFNVKCMGPDGNEFDTSELTAPEEYKHDGKPKQDHKKYYDLHGREVTCPETIKEMKYKQLLIEKQANKLAMSNGERNGHSRVEDLDMSEYEENQHCEDHDFMEDDEFKTEKIIRRK